MKRAMQAVLLDIRDGVLARPAPMMLAFFAICVGIASLTVLVAVLGGLQHRSRQLLQQLGADVVAVYQPREAGREGKRLDARHARLLRANLPGAQVASSRVYAVPTLGTNQLLTVVATDEHMRDVRQWPLAAGRFLDSHDLAARERKAVITESLSRAWHWNVGSIVLLHNLPFEVVGVVAVGGQAIDGDAAADPGLLVRQNTVFVPNSVSPVWSQEYEDPGSSVDAIFVKAPATVGLARVIAVSDQIFRQPDAQVPALSWITPDMLLQRVEQLRRTIAWSAGSVAVLCLILGGTALMAVLVSSVRERVIEIGLRRALGASRRDIAVLFMAEGGLVTAAAGACATVATHLVLTVAGPSLPVPLELSGMTFGLPIGVALALGALFSYWPAKGAATVSPSDALRDA
jgi:putative ABC transport system permease protein